MLKNVGCVMEISRRLNRTGGEEHPYLCASYRVALIYIRAIGSHGSVAGSVALVIEKNLMDICGDSCDGCVCGHLRKDC